MIFIHKKFPQKLININAPRVLPFTPPLLCPSPSRYYPSSLILLMDDRGATPVQRYFFIFLFF